MAEQNCSTSMANTPVRGLKDQLGNSTSTTANELSKQQKVEENLVQCPMKGDTMTETRTLKSTVSNPLFGLFEQLLPDSDDNGEEPRQQQQRGGDEDRTGLAEAQMQDDANSDAARRHSEAEATTHANDAEETFEGFALPAKLEFVE